MTRTAFSAAATLFFASAAGAGTFGVTFPNLTFPPAADVVVTKDCLTPPVATGECTTDE